MIIFFQNFRGLRGYLDFRLSIILYVNLYRVVPAFHSLRVLRQFLHGVIPSVPCTRSWLKKSTKACNERRRSSGEAKRFLRCHSSIMVRYRSFVLSCTEKSPILPRTAMRWILFCCAYQVCTEDCSGVGTTR